MSLLTKLTAFDYVIFKLTEWYQDENEQLVNNDLSKLKITKLLFFVTAISATPENKGLLTTFDNFAALPYGHVESQIQDHMHESANYSIDRNHVALKPGHPAYQVGDFEDAAVKVMIDDAVASLRGLNSGLISYNQFSLVDLSHRWQSWKTVFALAKRNGKFSMPIPSEMIMQEPKIFK